MQNCGLNDLSISLSTLDRLEEKSDVILILAPPSSGLFDHFFSLFLLLAV